MPKRTNRGQEIVALLRRLIAEDPGEIEESALLLDSATGDCREVDAVWRPQVHDFVVTVSFEVVDWSRRASVEWVDQQISKHATLETDRLVLVSWSGFTQGAFRKAAMHPNLVLVTPEDMGPSHPASVRQLRMMESSLTPNKLVSTVRKPDGSTIRVPCPPDIIVFDESGSEVCQLQALALRLVGARAVGERIFAEARRHQTPDLLIYFVLGFPLVQFELSLRWEVSAELHRLLEVEISGELGMKDHDFEISVSRFREILFGFATTTVVDREALVVAVLSEDGSVAKTAMRVYPGKASLRER